jgi:hypothetical protein
MNSPDGTSCRPDTTRVELDIRASEGDRKVGRPRGAAYPKDRKDPRLSLMDPAGARALMLSPNNARAEAGGSCGGDVDDSTHSSASSSVAQPGAAIVGCMI